MGEAALLVLVGTMIGMGGIADDPAMTVEDPLEAPEVTVDVGDAHAAASLDAPDQTTLDDEPPRVHATASTAGSVSADVATASADLDLVAAEQRVLERLDALPVETRYLTPAAGTVTIDVDTATEPQESSSSATHVTMIGTPTRPDEATGLTDLSFQLAPAAGMAALAAVHARPTLQGWRRWLPLGALVPLYSRISREDVLEHETREAVYELLKRSPGLSLEEIAEELDLSRSTARHHVRVLVDAEMIQHTTRGRCRIHYPVGRREEALQQHLLANENRARIARALGDTSRSLTELSEMLDESAGSVHFHLKKLCEAGLVERRENGAVTYEAATDALETGVTFEPAG